MLDSGNRELCIIDKEDAASPTTELWPVLLTLKMDTEEGRYV